VAIVIKTLHLTNAYHPSSGGIRSFYHALLAAAARHRRPVRLVVPAERSSIEDLGEFARIYRVRAIRSPIIDRRYRLILPYRFVFGRWGRIWNILRTERPDVVEVCDKYSLCHLGCLIRRRWFAGARRPALVGLSCERMDDNVAAFVSARGIGRSFSRWYMRHVYVPQFDGHVAVSSYAADELNGGPRDVHVAPLGLDVATFERAERSPAERQRVFGQIGAEPDTVLLLYAGRLSREKNIPLLLDTLDALTRAGRQRFRLVFAGDGPLRALLRDEALRRTPVRIHLLGHVADAGTLSACYANADVVLHPNPREPFGIAPLEAMASGTPLVVPMSGGVRQYATVDNAWLAEAEPAAFAQAVRDLLAYPGLRASRIASGRRTAHAHDWQCVTARYFEPYDDIYTRSAAMRPITEPRAARFRRRLQPASR
jgi:alpha-1,6-mannosyltransferase